MKNDTFATIFILIFFIGLIVLFFVGLRYVTISNSITYSEVCKLQYGEGWVYEYSEIFGQTCVEIDFVNLDYKQRVKVDFNPGELYEKYCKKIQFFNLKKWGNDCMTFVNDTGGE